MRPSASPAWTSPDHPIVHRELQHWRRRTERWRWLLLVGFLLLPVCGSVCCVLSASPILLEIFTQSSTDAGQIAAALFMLGGMILVGLWVFQSILSFGLSLLRGIGASTLIAYERETQNWSLLRLTPLGVEDVVRAKLAGLWRWLMWPTLLLLILRVFTLGITAIVVALIIAFTMSLSPPDLATQLQVWGYFVGGLIVFGLYYVVELIGSVLYDSIIGLVASSFSRTSATAIGMTFALNFGMNLFLFTPIQQVAATLTSVFGGIASILTNSPFFFIALTTLATSALQIFLLALTAVGGYYLALNQARNILE